MRTEKTGLKQLEHAANNFRSPAARATILALHNMLIYGEPYISQFSAHSAELIKGVHADAYREQKEWTKGDIALFEENGEFSHSPKR
jgi:hypothetical protein